MDSASATTVGETLPPLTPHAVSVSLPTWRANVGYEEGEYWVLSKMKSGYPRFYIHPSIQKLAGTVVLTYGNPEQKAVLFPSSSIAKRCHEFLLRQGVRNDNIIDFEPTTAHGRPFGDIGGIKLAFSAVLLPKSDFKVAKSFWQHTGEGISSRRAEWCDLALTHGLLKTKFDEAAKQRSCKGPRRYQKQPDTDKTSESGDTDPIDMNCTGIAEGQDLTHFLEERFGRNLDVSFAESAKLAVRRRIAGSLTVNARLQEALQAEKDVPRTRTLHGFSENDVYLYTCGMSAIYNTHRAILTVKGEMKSVSYGFPYIDTLKILEKFGPGCIFFGNDGEESLNDLQMLLENGEQILALFCEFPGNPLLRSPDLRRIRKLADTHGFLVVVDETIGNFLNVNVLPYADVVVSSLTKVFSGDSNVMGGSAILNPKSPHYAVLKDVWSCQYEDHVWPEDAIFLERNSRDFVSRINRINVNAEAVCDLLKAHPHVKQVNYPKCSPTRKYYDDCRNPGGGYGGLLSATFTSSSDAITFFDNLETAKGPSLGTNFTLSSPYVILAHYGELEWASSFGVEKDLIRFSVGLEDTEDLLQLFREALATIEHVNGVWKAI